MNDPLALIQSHPYISLAIAIIVVLIGQRKGWWTALLAKVSAQADNTSTQPQALLPAMAARLKNDFGMPGDENMGSMPAPSLLSAIQRTIRNEFASLDKGPSQPAMPDLTAMAADDAHTSLELARRHPDLHEPLTKAAADLIKKAVVVAKAV